MGERHARGRPIRKEQADARLHDFGCAGRQHVQLQDEVAAALEHPRSVSRLQVRSLAGGPTVDVLHPVVGHRGKARLTIAAIHLPRDAQSIDADAGVMQAPGIAGAELDRAHVAVRCQRHRHDKVAEDVRARGLELIGVRHLDHQVGPAKLPAVGPFRERWSVRGIALGGAFLGPALDDRNLVVSQSPGVRKRAGAALRQPGRHDATSGRIRDLFRVFAHVAILDQAERCARDAPLVVGRLPRVGVGGAVTRGAVLEQDGCDILVVGGCVSGGRAARRTRALAGTPRRPRR